MTSDLTSPPAGACSSAESDKDTYITQIIHRLEALHMSTIVNTQQASLLASISNAKEQEPTICCSQTKSSQVLKQHNTTQLRMFTHRWHRLGLQPPILWSSREHPKSAAETRPALDISPIQITLIEPSRDKGTDKTKTIVNSLCGRCNCGSLEGNISEKCSLNNPSQVSVECEDSDLSDLEKDNTSISSWATPVKLDLRPDSFDRDLELTGMTEDEQVYPAVLPVPLKDLDFSQSSNAELESQQNLHISDPCLTPMVTRLLELEKLQAATIQREQGRAVRSRPATALVRSANRLRRVESACNQAENLRTKGNNNLVLTDLAKLTLSSSSRSRSRQRTHPLSHSAKVQNALQQPHTSHKKPNTSIFTHNIAARSNLTPKCNSSSSYKTHKHVKNNLPMSKKTSVHSQSPCGKT